MALFHSFYAEEHSIAYIHCIFFIHSSVKEHLGCFYVLAFVNSVTYLLESLNFPDICPVMGFLDHMVVLVLVFKEISILFSIVAVSVYIPTNFARGGSLFSIPSPAFFFYRFFFVFWLMLAILTGVS